MRQSSLSLISIHKRRGLHDFLQKVKKEMLKNGIYKKKAKFDCLTDNVATYSLKTDSTLFEFSFICDDILFSKMRIKQLLELKDIEYFNQSIYICNGYEKISDISYKLHDDYVDISFN